MGQSFSVNFFESLHKEEWREVRLGEVAEIVGGGTPKTSIPEYWNGDIAWLSVADFNNGRKYVSRTQKTITEIGFKKSSTKILNQGDIIISARGTVGVVAMLKNPMAFNQTCYGIKSRESVNNHFLYYILKNASDSFVQNSYGSVFNTITSPILSNYNFLLPPLPIQNQIAEILSSFDDKIDLLHRQNQTLESLTLTLFRHHFIENPPNPISGNVNNRDKFGGETLVAQMESQNLSSAIKTAPPMWKMGKLRDYGKIVCGKTPSKNKKEYFNGEIPFIKIPDMHNKTFVFKTTDSLTQKGLQSQHTKILPPLSICVSCIATVGVVSMNAFESQTNQQINSIIPAQEYYRYFLYCFMKESYNELQTMASGGTATANLNTTDFSNMPILCPNDMELQKFHSLVSVYFDKIYNNSKQIQSLEQMRDLVLSKIFNEKMEE